MKFCITAPDKLLVIWLFRSMTICTTRYSFWSDHFQQFTGVAETISCQASDYIQLERIDSSLVVQDSIIDMNDQSFGVSRVPAWVLGWVGDDLRKSAFIADRCITYARWLDQK